MPLHTGMETHSFSVASVGETGNYIVRSLGQGQSLCCVYVQGLAQWNPDPSLGSLHVIAVQINNTILDKRYCQRLNLCPAIVQG